MRAKTILFVVLLLSVCYAEINPKGLSSATISMEFTGEGYVEGDYETINLTMFTVPVTDSRQTAVCDVTYPANYIFDKGDTLKYSYSCTVNTKQIGTTIKDSSLPLTNAPKEYLEQTEQTQLSPALEKIAQNLATTSLLDTAYAVNSWVYETIEYDTAYAFSIFAGAETDTRTPQDIYSRRLGICGDKAHLAIGMLRYLGIPARYVAGSSYGRLKESKFESHAWIEVWFPKSGWIPFDPTYGEYGYVDPSHVKFYHALDSTYPVWQTKYSYFKSQPTITWERNEDTQFETSKKSVNFEVSASTVSEAEFGDYVLVTAKVKNNLPIKAIANAKLYYEAGNLDDNFELVWGNASRLVWLKANEEKKVYWVLRAPTLDKNKYYVMPLTVGVEGERAEISLELYPDEDPTPSVTVTPESNSYGEGDTVNFAVELTNPELQTLTILPSGEIVSLAEKETELDLSAKADEDLAVWTSSGGFSDVDLTVEPQTLDVDVEGPSKVAQNQQFEIVLKVTGNAKSVTLDFEGESHIANLPAEFGIKKSLSDDTILYFTLTSGGKTKVVSKKITVVPTPKISHKFVTDGKIIEGMKTTIGVSGSGEVELQTDYGSASGQRSAMLEITPTMCGANTAKVTVSVSDELGNVYTKSFDETFEVVCGLDAWIAKLLAILGL